MYRNKFQSGLRVVLVTLVALGLLAAGASAQTAPYTRTVIVNKVGSATANGAALLVALSGLSPAPSSGDRWVIKIEGGFYDVGTTPIVLQPFVNLEGSGVYTTIVRGSVGPPPGYLLGGVVQGASNSELRDLTIQCISSASVPSCQAISLDTAHARLTDVRVLSGGTGTGSHWGIRTFDSQPTLDRVQVLSDAAGGTDNYGIVFSGSSTMNITRSSVIARYSPNNNWAILLKGNLNNSTLRDSEITASHGTHAAGIYYLESTTSNSLTIDNTTIVASAATTAVGLGRDVVVDNSRPTISFRHGRLAGSTHGFDHLGATVDLVNTEISGSATRVAANVARIGGTKLQGTGIIFGSYSLVCAGTFDGNYTFYASTCPP